MKSFKTTLFALTVFACAATAAHAADQMGEGHAMPQMSGDHAMPQMAQPMASAPLSEGVVRKVNKSAGKLTIKHGPLVNLDMMPMTMVFRVKDPAMLDQVKAGDNIRFLAESINGALTVVTLEKAAP